RRRSSAAPGARTAHDLAHHPPGATRPGRARVDRCCAAGPAGADRRMSRLGFTLRPRTFRSLRRHHNYRLFFTGQVVSLAGTWMQNVALAWLVLELSGSPLP